MEKEINFSLEDIYGNKYEKNDKNDENDKNYTKKLLDETSSHIGDDKHLSCSYFCNRLFNYCCFFLY